MIPITLDFDYYFSSHLFHIYFNTRSVNENEIHSVILDGFALDLKVLKEIETYFFRQLTEKMEEESKKFWAENKVKQNQCFSKMPFDINNLANNFFDKIKTA